MRVPLRLIPLCALPFVLRAGEPLVQVGRTLPTLLDLRERSAEGLLPRDLRDPAQVEAARQAWVPIVSNLRGKGPLRLLLPLGPERQAMLLAASQAFRAEEPGRALFVAFDPQAPSLWSESAWGAADGGILSPQDLGGDPAQWRRRLVEAQEQFPGRPWLLFLDQDPGEHLGTLLGDGARLVVPAQGPAARLGATLPRAIDEVEGGRGDLTLRTRNQGTASRWAFVRGEWVPTALPRERTEVVVSEREAYDVGALLARVRASQLRDRAAIRTAESTLKVDLHFQGEQGGGDMGFTFQSFEALGEPEELLRRQVRLNGVSAKLHGEVPLPIVEARTAVAAPVSLALTERYRYTDGGEAGPGRHRLRFEPVDGDPELFSGEVVVEEATGRILEERSSRKDLPGIVRSESRIITYGEPLPGFWRPVKVLTFERWVASGGVAQVQRTLAYGDWKLNDPGFVAHREAVRAGDGAILRQTVQGLRYYVKQKDGTRKLEEKPRTAGRAAGGVLIFRGGDKPPVVPAGGLALFDFDALGKGIQYSLLTAGVVNYGSVTVPKAVAGFDLHSSLGLNFLTFTERPVRNGYLLNSEGVGRRTQVLRTLLGRDLGAGFRLEAGGSVMHDTYSLGDKDYRTPGFVLPPSGATALAQVGLEWQFKGFEVEGNYSAGRRPDGIYGVPGRLTTIAEEGRLKRWSGRIGLDREVVRGVRFFTGIGFAGGRNFDRFFPVDFDGRVSGIRANAVAADRMTYGNIGVGLQAGPGLHLTLTANHGRARSMDDQKTYRFTGAKVSGDLPGFGWFTLTRIDVSAGLQSDIRDMKVVQGMIGLLRLF